MMPPKKSRAARATKEVPEEVPEPVENNNEPEPPPAAENKEAEEEKEVKVKKFMWEDEHVEGKRKRVMPQAEQKLHDWLSEHLEERDETKVVTSEVYNTYLEGCISCAESGVDQITFSKILHQRFPKAYGIKSTSTYADVIKERKIRKKVPRVQADSLKLKLRDLIENCLNELKNPRKGIRFHTIKQFISLRYPALRLDVRQHILKNALEKGIRFGYIIRVKGIGAAGFYRLPGGPDEEEEEVKDKKVKKEEKDGEKEGEDEGKDEEKVDEEENADEEKENEEGGEEEKGKRKSRKAAPKKESGKKKDAAKKKRRPTKTYRTSIVHSDPERIEDAFSMAMTYMAEPKDASVRQIRRYIERNYRETDVDIKMKKIMAQGIEKGLWMQVSGNGPIQGSYRLLVDEFDPTDDDNLFGKVTNAIMACHEPKECSANLLKRYLIEYHPEFKIQEKPYLFKKALERAVKKNQIRQITGIGASGTFQLVQQFHPMPIILAGQDTNSDYDSDEEDFQPILEAPDVSMFQDSYVPRPTKRHARKGAAGIDRFTDIKFNPRYRNPEAKSEPQKNSGESKGRGRNQFKESDFQDPYVPRPTKRGHARSASEGIDRFTNVKVENPRSPQKSPQKKKRGAAKPAAKSPQKPKYAESSESDSSDSDSSPEDDAPPAKKPRGPPKERSAAPASTPRKAPAKSAAKGKAKGGKAAATPKAKTPAEKKAPATPTPTPTPTPVKTPAQKKARSRRR